MLIADKILEVLKEFEINRDDPSYRSVSVWHKDFLGEVYIYNSKQVSYNFDGDQSFGYTINLKFKKSRDSIVQHNKLVKSGLLEMYMRKELKTSYVYLYDCKRRKQDVVDSILGIYSLFLNRNDLRRLDVNINKVEKWIRLSECSESNDNKSV